jgi:hypothetical protein
MEQFVVRPIIKRQSFQGCRLPVYWHKLGRHDLCRGAGTALFFCFSVEPQWLKPEKTCV